MHLDETAKFHSQRSPSFVKNNKYQPKKAKNNHRTFQRGTNVLVNCVIYFFSCEDCENKFLHLFFQFISEHFMVAELGTFDNQIRNQRNGTFKQRQEGCLLQTG